jgi:hypothetical protein
MRARRLSIAGALFLLWGLGVAGSAQACSCATMPASEAMREADAAIIGRLVKIVPSGGSQADYRYRVQGVYKASRAIRRGRIISVRSSRQPSACGLPSRKGRRYGLFLEWGEGRWSGGICGVVKPVTLRSATQRGGRARRLQIDCAN